MPADSGPLEPSLEQVVDRLLPLYRTGDVDAADGSGPALPHRRRVIEAYDLIKAALLPGGMLPEAVRPELLRMFVAERLSRAFRLLTVEVSRALPLRWRGAFAQHEAKHGLATPQPISEAELVAEASRIVGCFFGRLPAVRELVIGDVQAAYNGDPAALNFAEVMLCYPGVQAICGHRLAHELHRLEVPVVPRIMSEYTHATFGVDIHPGATIGRNFFMDHATGIVIGETAQVGDDVKLYQGVTLGAKSFPLDEHGHPQKRIQRHPTVEDRVIIYSNASILGPVTIGAGSEVGGNVFLTRSVPPGSRVRQRAEVEVREPASG